MSSRSNAEMDVDTYIIEEHIEIDDSISIAPVVIEEFDEASALQMDVDLGEFVEAEAIQIQPIPKSRSVQPKDQVNSKCVEVELELNDQRTLSIEEENLLTTQFLNGEMSFCQYASKMNQGSDCEEIIESSDPNKSKSLLPEALPEVSSHQTNGKSTSKPKSRSKRIKRSLPPALQGLMGEANLRYARGEVELATQMCMEIIRQMPSAPEPFQTLAMIYENEDPEKAQQFSLIAAHLAPKNTEQWVRLATASLDSGNLKQAIICYSKAIQTDPRNIDLYETRAQLQVQNGEKKVYLRAYSKLIHHLKPEDSKNIFKYGKLLTQLAMEENLYDTALEGMDSIFKKCPELVTLEEVNQILDVLILLRKFQRCLDILEKYTTIHIEYCTSNREKIVSCNIADDIPVDIKAKCIISLIELDQSEIAERVITKFYTLESPEISGDLFLDIAESLMGRKKFEEALNLLDPLVKSSNYSLAAVWLRHGECHLACGNHDKAIESYEMVKKLSPQHLDARKELNRIYKLRGDYAKAVEALEQNPETDILEPRIIYEKIQLLLKLGRYKEYFENGILLFSRHCDSIRSKSDLIALSRASGVKNRMDILHRDRLSRGEPLVDENAPEFSKNNEPTLQQEFLLLLQMCRVAYKLRKFGLLQRICFSALTSKKFTMENPHILFLCLISCIHNNDSFHGFNVVRDLVRSVKKSKSWNLLNIIIQKAEDSRHNRFMMRVLSKEDAFSNLHILHANNCLVSGTYKYALNDYISLFKVKPDPLLALLIGVTLLQMACQKFAAKKNQLVAQAIAFFKTYMKLRGEGCHQETNYNMARALHQIGLLTGAIHFYKLVIESPLSEVVEKRDSLLNLKKEAAFNLHLIYLNSENYQLACTYLDQFITI